MHQQNKIMMSQKRRGGETHVCYNYRLLLLLMEIQTGSEDYKMSHKGQI